MREASGISRLSGVLKLRVASSIVGAFAPRPHWQTPRGAGTRKDRTPAPGGPEGRAYRDEPRSGNEGSRTDRSHLEVEV